jgi:hypothetical protein
VDFAYSDIIFIGQKWEFEKEFTAGTASETFSIPAFEILLYVR